jgi:hypothetical protein
MNALRTITRVCFHLRSRSVDACRGVIYQTLTLFFVFPFFLPASVPVEKARPTLKGFVAVSSVFLLTPFALTH